MGKASNAELGGGGLINVDFIIIAWIRLTSNTGEARQSGFSRPNYPNIGATGTTFSRPVRGNSEF